VLERAGLISRRKHGREVLYQVEAERLDQAARAMAELAAQRGVEEAAFASLNDPLPVVAMGLTDARKLLARAFDRTPQPDVAQFSPSQIT